MATTRSLTNWSEGRTLRILERNFRGSSCAAYPKVRLADVVAADTDDLVPGDAEYLMRAHLDFVVCDRGRQMTPVFAVEFDGPGHADDPQQSRDRRKNRLCAAARLPLLRVGDVEIADHDRRTLLDYMMSRVIAWQYEAPALSEEINDYFGGLDADTQAAYTSFGILDPSIDVSFQFHLRHPFPGIAAVSKRLSRYGIGSLHGGPADGWPPMTALDVGQGFEGVGTHCLITKRGVVVRNDGRPPSWGPGCANPDDVLVECAAHFSMQWLSPTADDYDWSETAAEYHARTGAFPWVVAQVPGLSVPDIAESFAVYLWLREVENWAASALPTTD